MLVLSILILGTLGYNQQSYAQVGGPVIIAGTDPCFHLPDTIGAQRFIENVADYMTNQVGGDNILILGDVELLNFLTSLGYTVTFYGTLNEIENLPFDGFDVIMIGAPQVCENVDAVNYHGALLSRTSDFTDHVNGGGGLVAFSAYQMNYDYLQGLGSFTSIDENSELAAIVDPSHPIFDTLMLTDLIWGNFVHNALIAFPPGYQTLALSGSGNSAIVFALHGTSTDDDGDGIPNDEDLCPGFDDNVDTDSDGIPNECDPFESSQVCGAGTVGDNNLQQCVGTGGKTCGDGTIMVGNECVVDPNLQEIICGQGTAEILGICVPDLAQICGQGTIISGMQCVAQQVNNIIGGVLLDIDNTALFVAAIGTNPVITGLVAVTIAGVSGQAIWYLHKKQNSNKS